MHLRMVRAALAAVIAVGAICVGVLERGTFLSSSRSHAQQLEEVFPSQPVPAGYETQTLLLICNFDWLREERQEDLNALYVHFALFGRAIGRKNAAVWFWKESPNLQEDPAAAVDIERNAQLCAERGLKASESPYLAIASKWDEDHAILELGELDAIGIKNVLVAVADKLIAGDSDLEEVRSRVYWESWQTAFRNIPCIPFKVIFKTQVLTTELDAGRC